MGSDGEFLVVAALFPQFPHFQEFFISSASILLMFVAAVVESWYAGGHLSYAVYDHSAWVAAAVDTCDYKVP